MDTPDAHVRQAGTTDSEEQTDQAPPFSPFSPAWERDGRSLKSFVITIYQVLRHPVRTFSAPGSASRTPAIIFGVVLLTLERIASQIIGQSHDQPLALSLVFILIGIFMHPIYVYLGLLFEAWVLRGFLKVTLSKDVDSTCTFRVFAYVSGSLAIFTVIPLAGIWIGLGLGTVLMVYALAAALDAPKRRVLPALLLNYAFFFIIALLFYFRGGFSIMGFIT